MARPLRIEFAGALYHVISRGNERKPIVRDDLDREKRLDWLRRTVETYGWRLHAFVLMTNHEHLFVQTPEANLSAGMQYLGGSYTSYFNRRHRRAGHLMQGRYRGHLIDAEGYFLEVSRYLHLNPVRAKLCRRPWRYEWSSAAAHTDERARSQLLDLSDWYEQMPAEAWRKELSRMLNDAELAQVRLRTHTGRPLGSDSFLSKLETLLGRRLRALPPGRPKKGKSHASRA